MLGALSSASSAPSVRAASLALLKPPRSAVSAQAPNAGGQHAEPSTLVSFSVYLPLLRILHQLFGLEYTALPLLQQTMASNTQSSGIFEREKKNKKLTTFYEM